jgi:predicted RNase H-like nuclease (RuvC/YqgF family)
MARQVEAAGQPGRRGVAGEGDRLCICGAEKCSGECLEGLSAQLEKVDREAESRLMDTIDWAAAAERAERRVGELAVALDGERARSASLRRQLEEMRRMWLDAEGRAAFGRAA